MKVLDADSPNPRIQCSRCGRWSRLYTKGVQWHFPYYPAEFDPPQEGQDYEDLCVPCHRELGHNLYPELVTKEDKANE